MGLINSAGTWFEKITGGWTFGSTLHKLTMKGTLQFESNGNTAEHIFRNFSGTVAFLSDIPDFAPVSVTKAALDTLIGSSTLVPGTVYIITDADTLLYGGTQIALRAQTTNKLQPKGVGLFYNPIYDSTHFTLKLWNDFIYIQMSNVVGSWTPFDTVTTNNGATGTYRGAGLIQFTSGNWVAATSMTNDFTAGTADFVTVNPSNPAYSIGDKVIWGGRVWENVNGLIGAFIDYFNLDSEWSLVAFDEVDYRLAIDEIEYDYTNDLITSRVDSAGNVVSCSYQGYLELQAQGASIPPIKAFQWGYRDAASAVGSYENKVINSYVENLNNPFFGFAQNTFTQLSIFQNNIGGVQHSFMRNTVIQRSSIKDCIIGLSGGCEANIIDSNSIVSGNQGNIMGGNNKITSGALTNNINYSSAVGVGNNVLEGGVISENMIYGSGNIGANILLNGAYITQNKLYEAGDIVFNSLAFESTITNNIVHGLLRNNHITGSILNNLLTTASCEIKSNTLHGGSLISGNNLYETSVGSKISNNKLSEQSEISGIDLTDSAIEKNELKCESVMTFTGIPAGENVRFVEANNMSGTFDLTSATIIFAAYTRFIYRKSTGSPQVKLSYYNGSDVLTSALITA